MILQNILQQVKDWDTQLFLFINGKHSVFFDTVMYWVSDKYFWIPIYLLLIYFLIKEYKKKAILILLFVAVLITITDQLSVHLFKDVFHRLRPCHEPSLSLLVHTVNDSCGGLYGFISSHAANSFALAVFMMMLIGKKIKYFTIYALFYAIIISYSRIYLGKHYPLDVLCGAIIGSGIASALYVWYSIIDKKYLNK